MSRLTSFLYISVYRPQFITVTAFASFFGRSAGRKTAENRADQCGRHLLSTELFYVRRSSVVAPLIILLQTQINPLTATVGGGFLVSLLQSKCSKRRYEMSSPFLRLRNEMGDCRSRRHLPCQKCQKTEWRESLVYEQSQMLLNRKREGRERKKEGERERE